MRPTKQLMDEIVMNACGYPLTPEGDKRWLDDVIAEAGIEATTEHHESGVGFSVYVGGEQLHFDSMIRGRQRTTLLGYFANARWPRRPGRAAPEIVDAEESFAALERELE